MTRADCALFSLGDFEITFLLIALFTRADLAPEGFGSEARDDASFFALSRRQLALLYHKKDTRIVESLWIMEVAPI